MDLTVRKLSILLNVPRHKIYQLLRNGKIPHKRVNRGNRSVILFEREAVRRCLADAKGQIGSIRIPEDAVERLNQTDAQMSPLEMERIVTEIRKIKREIDKIPKIRKGGGRSPS